MRSTAKTGSERLKKMRGIVEMYDIIAIFEIWDHYSRSFQKIKDYSMDPKHEGL